MLALLFGAGERTNVYNIFKRQSIDTETLLRISQILNHDFFSYYRQQIGRTDFNDKEMPHKSSSVNVRIYSYTIV